MRNPLVIAVNALGITQITAWGTSFYCLGVLAKPIAPESLAAAMEAAAIMKAGGKPAKAPDGFELLLKE